MRDWERGGFVRMGIRCRQDDAVGIIRLERWIIGGLDGERGGIWVNIWDLPLIGEMRHRNH